jgi:hypothetical protein
LETEEITKRKQGPEKSFISKKVSGDDPLTPDYLYVLQKEGIVDLQMEEDGSFLSFDVRKKSKSSSDLWCKILKKLKECGFFEVVRGQWSNSWVNGKWSDRIVF